MSARYSQYGRWASTGAAAAHESDEDEEDEDGTDNEATASMDSSLSRRMYALAKEVSNLETEKYRIHARKQREITRLEEENQELEESNANLKYDLMKRDDEISSLKAKLRSNRSSASVAEEVVLLRLQNAVLTRCLVAQQKAARALVSETIDPADSARLRELANGDALFGHAEDKPILQLLMGQDHEVLQRIDPGHLTERHQMDAGVYEEKSSDDKDDKDDDDDDADDGGLERTAFDAFDADDFDPRFILSLISSKKLGDVHRLLDDARRGRPRKERRPLYDLLGYLLSKAVTHGDVEMCKLLLNRKANILYQDHSGRTLLHIAARSRNEAVLKLLLQRVGSSTSDNEISELKFQGNLQYHIAPEDRLAWLDRRDHQGRSALHSAARLKHRGCVSLLLFHGCDVELRTGEDNDGDTAMELGTNNRVQVAWGDSGSMKTLFESDIQNLWNRSTRSALLYKAGDYEAALDCYGAAVKFGQKALASGRVHTKDLSRLHYNRGRAAVRCERFSEALRCCNEALELDPRYFSAMRMRATCKMELFDFDSACKDWEWVMDRRMFLPDGEAPLVRKELRRARKCRDATHYDILGINKLASQKDIIKAYRTASINWHPDKQAGRADGTARANALFQRVNEAKQVLCDSSKRMMYDYEQKYSFKPSRRYADSDDEDSDDGAAGGDSGKQWPWMKAAAAAAEKKKVAAAAREAELVQQQREFERHERIARQREQQQQQQQAKAHAHAREHARAEASASAAAKLASSTVRSTGGGVAPDAAGGASEASREQSFPPFPDDDDDGDDLHSEGDELHSEEADEQWRGLGTWSQRNPFERDHQDVFDEAEFTAQALEAELERLSQHSSLPKMGKSRTATGLRMDSADANGAAGDTSKKKPRGGGMFAGMKGGFFKKKKDANGGPPEAAAGSADEASGQGAGEDDGPPLPKAQFDGEMPNAHKHVDTEAGVHDDDNDDDDDDDASSPYAHYRLHGEDGAYWAEPAAGRSRPGMDEADEESGTESSDFLTSDGGAEGEEDDEAQDDNDYAHVDVKTFMNELAAEKDPWGSSSASDAERSSDEDNGASEEPTISSKAAARYLFLLDFGFDGSLAIEVAELQMDWDAYSMVSGHLSKDEQWQDILSYMRSENIDVGKFEALGFGMDQFLDMIKSADQPLASAVQNDSGSGGATGAGGAAASSDGASPAEGIHTADDEAKVP